MEDSGMEVTLLRSGNEILSHCITKQRADSVVSFLLFFSIASESVSRVLPMSSSSEEISVRHPISSAANDDPGIRYQDVRSW
jgi:hypothetical protein